MVSFAHAKTIKKQFPKFESNDKINHSGTNINRSALNENDDWDNPQSHTEFEVFRLSSGVNDLNWDEKPSLAENFSLGSKDMADGVEELKAYDKQGEDEINFLQSQNNDEKIAQRISLFNRNRPLIEKMNSFCVML